MTGRHLPAAIILQCQGLASAVWYLCQNWNTIWRLRYLISNTCNNDIYFRHIFPNMRFWYSASLPSQQWNTNQGENVSMIAIKVEIKCYDKPKITSETSGTGLEWWKLVLQGKSFCADKGNVSRCDYNGRSADIVGIGESIYSRSIAVCHQQWPRCGRQVVLSYSPMRD